MPMLSIDNDLKNRVKKFAEKHNLSIKGTICLLLDSVPESFSSEDLNVTRRLYPTRELLSSNWEAFWNVLKAYVNNTDKTYTIEEAADLASCSPPQMQSLFDLMVLIGCLKKSGKGYIRLHKKEITLALKETRQMQYDHRAGKIIELLEKHPEGLRPTFIEEELGFSGSWLKGCAKNPLVKDRVTVTADLWKLAEEAPKKRRKAPVKRRKIVRKTT